MSALSRRVEKLELENIEDDEDWDIVLLAEDEPVPENPDDRNRIIVRFVKPKLRPDPDGDA